MACLSCAQARAAASAAVKAVANGSIREAAAQTARMTDALKDKAESMRVRMLTRRL